MEEEKVSQYFVAYEDKGPSGPCGQITSVTSPWRKLYVFTDEAKSRELVKKVTENPFNSGRLYPKIIGYWSDIDESVIRDSIREVNERQQ